LTERVRRILTDRFADSTLKLWLKDVLVRTSPVSERDGSSSRRGLAGEVARQAALALEDKALLALLRDEALGDLFNHTRLRRVLTMPEGTELEELTASARDLCCGLLEGE
jgi:hypothetical protein